uniref:Transcription initiation factor IIA subunit 1 n=1 Tax=Angiostrongylus costaricensis TaxID=334426 RepID=A0A158PL84_ANGCS
LTSIDFILLQFQAEIYKGVIQDVISQVKEAFLDENVDIDVLSQLKKEWEDKVIASGCVDMEPRHQVAPPPMRPHVMQPRMGTVTQVRLQAAPQQALGIAQELLMALQLDGGGGGGMYICFLSRLFHVDDDDDPIRRIADRIGDGQIDDGEQIVEEDPLNSGDDQSDDEDLETLFDADNVIMCQFEKVHRARSKWKFQLKDGIMHIDNKDYCFQKCSGEAEW